MASRYTRGMDPQLAFHYAAEDLKISRAISTDILEFRGRVLVIPGGKGAAATGYRIDPGV